MNVKLEDWAVNARTAALILNVSVKTLNTWRFRDGLLPQNWAGPGRAPEKCYQLRDLIQVRVAQKLISVGLPVSKACQAANVSHMEPFFRGEQYTFGFADGELRTSYDPEDDVVLGFYLENDGWSFAHALAVNICEQRGEDVGQAAYLDFQRRVNDLRARLSKA